MGAPVPIGAHAPARGTGSAARGGLAGWRLDRGFRGAASKAPRKPTRETGSGGRGSIRRAECDPPDRTGSGGWRDPQRGTGSGGAGAECGRATGSRERDRIRRGRRGMRGSGRIARTGPDPEAPTGFGAGSGSAPRGAIKHQDAREARTKARIYPPASGKTTKNPLARIRLFCLFYNRPFPLSPAWARLPTAAFPSPPAIDRLPSPRF